MYFSEEQKTGRVGTSIYKFHELLCLLATTAKLQRVEVCMPASQDKSRMQTDKYRQTLGNVSTWPGAATWIGHRQAVPSGIGKGRHDLLQCLRSVITEGSAYPKHGSSLRIPVSNVMLAVFSWKDAYKHFALKIKTSTLLLCSMSQSESLCPSKVSSH